MGSYTRHPALFGTGGGLEHLRHDANANFVVDLLLHGSLKPGLFGRSNRSRGTRGNALLGRRNSNKV